MTRRDSERTCLPCRPAVVHHVLTTWKPVQRGVAILLASLSRCQMKSRSKIWVDKSPSREKNAASPRTVTLRSTDCPGSSPRSSVKAPPSASVSARSSASSHLLCPRCFFTRILKPAGALRYTGCYLLLPALGFSVPAKWESVLTQLLSCPTPVQMQKSDQVHAVEQPSNTGGRKTVHSHTFTAPPCMLQAPLRPPVVPSRDQLSSLPISLCPGPSPPNKLPGSVPCQKLCFLGSTAQDRWSHNTDLHICICS